jgi:hypothetical protein
MNKQILENRLIDSAFSYYFKNYAGSQLVSQVTCFQTFPEIKSKIKNH